MDYTHMQQLDSAVAKIMASIPRSPTSSSAPRVRTLTEIPSAKPTTPTSPRARTMSDTSTPITPTTPKTRPTAESPSASSPDTPRARSMSDSPSPTLLTPSRSKTMSEVPTVRPPVAPRAKSEAFISSNTASSSTLPQFGFGTDCHFDSLLKHHHFLFRVHTPRRSAQSADAPFFVGRKFESEALPEYPSKGKSVAEATYDDAAAHLDWTTRSSSPFVSASFSFAWAIWEATKRYKVGVKHDVEVAVIDAQMFMGRAYTAAELLQKGSPDERRKDHWKWHRFAMESQDVLIYGHVPPSSILTSVPLTQLVAHLPSYFLYSPPTSAAEAELAKSFPLSRLVWSGNPTYRNYCQELSERFLRLNLEERLVETSVGSVRLALSFLRPWFARELAAEGGDNALTNVKELALDIARWPGAWWVRDHPEVADFIRATVRVVSEEVRSVQKDLARTEGQRVHTAVTHIEERADHRGHERRVDRSSEDSGYFSDNESRPRGRVVGGRIPRPRPRSLRALSPSARLSIAESDVTLLDGDDDLVVKDRGSALPFTPPFTPPFTRPSTPPATETLPPPIMVVGSSPLSKVVDEVVDEVVDATEEDDASSVQSEETSAEPDTVRKEDVLTAADEEDLTLVSISIPSLTDSDFNDPPSQKEAAVVDEEATPVALVPPSTLRPTPVKVDVSVWTDPEDIAPVAEASQPPRHDTSEPQGRDDPDDDIHVTPASYFVLANVLFGMFITIVVLSQPRRYHYISFT